MGMLAATASVDYLMTSCSSNKFCHQQRAKIKWRVLSIFKKWRKKTGGTGVSVTSVTWGVQVQDDGSHM